MNTYASKIKQQLEEVGYSFFKCEEKYWNIAENDVVLESNRSLGDLLRDVGKSFGIA